MAVVAPQFTMDDEVPPLSPSFPSQSQSPPGSPRTPGPHSPSSSTPNTPQSPNTPHTPRSPHSSHSAHSHSPRSPHSHAHAHAHLHAASYSPAASSAPVPINNPHRKRRTSSGASDALATPATPSIIGMLGQRKRSGYGMNTGYGSGNTYTYNTQPGSYTYNPQPGSYNPYAGGSFTSQGSYFSLGLGEHDHIPLERGGSTEGRRRSSVGRSPGVPAVAEERRRQRERSQDRETERDTESRARETDRGETDRGKRREWGPEFALERERREQMELERQDERAVETLVTPDGSEADRERELPPIPGSLPAPPTSTAPAFSPAAPIPAMSIAAPIPVPANHQPPTHHQQQPASPRGPQIAAPHPLFVPYGPLALPTTAEPPAPQGSGSASASVSNSRPRSFSATLRRRIDRSKTLALLKLNDPQEDVPDMPAPAGSASAHSAQVGVGASSPSVPSLASPSPAPTPASVDSAGTLSSIQTPIATSTPLPYAHTPASDSSSSTTASTNLVTDSSTGRYKRKLKSLINATRRRRAQSLTSPAMSQVQSTSQSQNQSQMAQTLSSTFTLPTPYHSHPHSQPDSAPESRTSSFRASVREYPAMNMNTTITSATSMSSNMALAASPLGLSLPLSTPLDLNLNLTTTTTTTTTATSPRISPRRTTYAAHRAMSLPHNPFNVVLTSAGLQPVNSDELVWGTLSYRAPARTDYFSSRLPRELKVKVFRALLDSYAARPGTGRWDGVNAGRRELVRLSCVSKEWRSLCFDGQLWATADFTPFAAVMHPGTVREILLHARPCVKELSVRGLDAITGWSLTVRELEAPATSLPSTIFSSLTTLDLFGCHDLTPKDVVALIALSPNLKRINLKGSRLSLAYVLTAIATHVTALEDLDISRCWSLEFLDVEMFIAALNDTQKAALKSLRIAGLTSTTGGHLMRRIGTDLPNLARLDLLNCRWLGTLDIRDYIAALPGPHSPLTHLVISGCTNLTTDALEMLIGKLPHMTHFEAAGLEPVFYLDPPPTLARLVRTMPKLVRLDLDSTGRYGGVCDRLLDELIPGAVHGSPLVESQLVELRIGGAKNVTAAGIAGLVSALPKLATLEVDGTEADNAVLRAFLAHRSATGAAPGSISLIDCHRVTHDVFSVVAGLTRARAGWDDYRGTVFAYTDRELAAERTVLKTFWAWRAVRPPKLWREARSVGEAGSKEVSERQVIVKSAWWRSEDVDEMERGACVIM